MLLSIKRNELNENTDNSSFVMMNTVFSARTWEYIKNIRLIKHNFFFKRTEEIVQLYRKAPANGLFEKYILKNDITNINIAELDIKTYKDCVFIAGLTVNTDKKYQNIYDTLIQIAVEISLTSTTHHKVQLNVICPKSLKATLKKKYKSMGFISEENQTEYEKNTFGEMMILKVTQFPNWIKKVKKFPILSV